MHLSISSPDQQLFEGTAQKLTLPGSKGLFQVLKDHAPLVTTLQQGKILYQVDTQEHILTVDKGLVEINNNQVTILIETNLI